jgi:hypothetical protein
MKTFNITLLILVTFLFVNHSKSLAQQPGAKVYWMATVSVPIGKLPEYHVFAEKELIPVQEKYGYRFIGGWQTIIGDIEEAVVISEFDNMDAYLKARVALLTSAEWKTVGEKLDALSKGVRTRMLSAVPYINMK